MIAVAIMALIVGGNLYNASFGGHTIVSTLLLLGFIKGHRLAWQWGRIFPVIGIAGGLLFMIISTKSFATNWIFLGLELVYITLVVALGRPAARAYFKLICPKCGKPTWRAADFLFNKAKCKPCDFVWE